MSVNFKTLPSGYLYGDKVYIAMFPMGGDHIGSIREIRTDSAISKDNKGFMISDGSSDRYLKNGRTNVSQAIQFTIERTKNGAFAFREVLANGRQGNFLVRAGDWLNLTSSPDGETEAWGWKYYSDPLNRRYVWDTPVQPVELYSWSAGTDHPVREEAQARRFMTIRDKFGNSGRIQYFVMMKAKGDIGSFSTNYFATFYAKIMNTLRAVFFFKRRTRSQRLIEAPLKEKEDFESVSSV